MQRLLRRAGWDVEAVRDDIRGFVVDRHLYLPESWVHHGGGVPVFVVSHRPPDPSVADLPSVTDVTDGIESAMAQAKAAAGERGVHVIGAYTAQRAIRAGVLGEVQARLIPVLFGGGRRLFDVLPSRVGGTGGPAPGRTSSVRWPPTKR